MHTYAFDELLFGEETGLIAIELPEQPLSPVPVLMEEEKEVVEIDLAFYCALGEVTVHEMQHEYLLIAD